VWTFALQTALRSHHGKYVCAEQNHTVVANRDASGPWEKWEVVAAGVYQVPHYQPPPAQAYPSYPAATPTMGYPQGGYPPAPGQGYPPSPAGYAPSPSYGYPPSGLQPGQYPPGHY
jgi:hypothetical protein